MFYSILQQGLKNIYKYVFSLKDTDIKQIQKAETRRKQIVRKIKKEREEEQDEARRASCMRSLRVTTPA